MDACVRRGQRAFIPEELYEFVGITDLSYNIIVVFPQHGKDLIALLQGFSYPVVILEVLYCYL